MSMTRLQEQRLCNDKVGEMFYFIPCVQKMHGLANGLWENDTRPVRVQKLVVDGGTHGRKVQHKCCQLILPGFAHR